MATFFHGNPEIQPPDDLHTHLLMNPAYLHYSHTPPPPPNNLVFLNSLSPNAPSSHAQQLVGISLPTTSVANQDSLFPLHGLLQRVHYNFYNPIDPSGPARDTPRAQQGLSLTLSSHQQPGYGSQAQVVSGEDMRVSGCSASPGSAASNGVSGIQSVLSSSKYLKAAQELLDDVVNVNNRGITKSETAKKGTSGNNSHNSKATGESSAVARDDSAGGKLGAELSTAERQEIQMKKAKLISMLDEVNQRYRQYHHQMQIVISSFEQAAGIGSAKTYTALALKTISKQFRCLKDAIIGQIGAVNRSLGEEEDCLGEKTVGSRLRFVDHQLRQQRALQQLGMIQHNAWRPQRGLPERSVSVLRAWLFEHFLHPYPKDSDKHMLAKQTGLTRSQVSNWFINARVRLWKPMVEEMYLEEIKGQEQSNEDSASKSTGLEKSPAPAENQAKSSSMSISMASTSPLIGNVENQPRFSVIGSSELKGITQGSPKKPRSTEALLQSPTSVPSINNDINQREANDEVSIKFGKEGYSFMGPNTNFMGGFSQYPIAEMARFDAEQFAPRFPGSGVSLTLGLPHCENFSQTFLPNQSLQMGRLNIGEPNEFGAINHSTPHSSAAYENRKRFAAQLLPDFVA